TPNKSSRNHWTGRRFTSGSRMGRSDLIAFNHLAQFPTRQDVGNAAALVDGTHDDFGNEFAVTTDQKFTIVNHALVLADVQDDKIPLRINHENFSAKVSPQSDDRIRTFVHGQTGLYSGLRTLQNQILFV